MGNEVFMYMLSGTNTFVGRLDPRTTLRVGQQAQIVFNMDNMHIFEKDGAQLRIQ
jgi:ABC-type sugar transport system ATPase subunit